MVAQEAKKAETQEKTHEEKKANCLGCGKPIKKIKRYYRNGAFYCNKKCWLGYIKKAKEEKK